MLSSGHATLLFDSHLEPEGYHGSQRYMEVKLSSLRQPCCAGILGAFFTMLEFEMWMRSGKSSKIGQCKQK